MRESLANQKSVESLLGIVGYAESRLCATKGLLLRDDRAYAFHDTMLVALHRRKLLFRLSIKLKKLRLDARKLSNSLVSLYMLRKRLLLVDDNVDVATVFSRMLERKGYDLTTAHSVDQGLSYAQSTQYDLVICDLRSALRR